MPKEYRKELSFLSGEISPRFFGRSDTEVYNQGLAIAENVAIDKRGGAFKRKGYTHVSRTDGNNARLFSIQASRTRFYTILITDLKMTLIAPGASMLGNSLLINSNFAQAGVSWSTTAVPATSSVVFRSGECDLLPEQDDPQLISNGSFDAGGLGWTERVSSNKSSVSFSNGDCTLQVENKDNKFAGIFQSVTTGSTGVVHTLNMDGNYSSGSVRVRIGTAEADGTYLDVVTVTPLEELTFTPAASPFTITFDCESPDQLAILHSVSIAEPIVRTAEISQQATVTAAITDVHLLIVSQLTAEIIELKVGTTQGASDIASLKSTSLETRLTFVPNNATYWVTVVSDGSESVGSRLSFIGTAEDAVSSGTGFEMAAPWTEQQLDEIHVVPSPNGEAYYFTHPNVPVQRLIYNFKDDTFVNLIAVAFTNPIQDSTGIADLWTGTNHPSTGTFFQGRLWLGGTPNEPQTFWGSYSGTPEDFLLEEGGTPAPTASTAVVLTLREYGAIEWMLGTKNLLIGTENGEHIITSEGGVITPLDFDIQQQSSYGSNNTQSIQVAEKVFYLTPDGRKIQSMSYEWQEDNWLSQDLTFASEHITEGVGKYVAWAQHPNNLFGVVLADGTLAIMTYDSSTKTKAWTHAFVPGFKILDITTGRIDGINELVIVGQRVNGKLDVEQTGENVQYLDSYVSVFEESGTDVITGLDHLEGLSVRPIVDGAVEPLKTVIGGQITTEAKGNQLYAGMDYTGKIKTLPPDSQQTQIRSFKKRWNKVWALLLDSHQPIINGIRPPDRTPSTPMNTIEPITSGHFKTVNLGWDDFGQITIEEPLPVSMNIIAIYGEMGAESL